MQGNRCAEGWNKLERLVQQWRVLDGESSSARMALNFEMTETMLALFPDQDALEAVGAFWASDLEKFDPEKGNFRSYLLSRLKLREKDLRRQDLGMHRESYEEGGEKRQRWIQAASLDEPLGEDQGETLGERLAGPGGDSGLEALQAQETAQELIALILLLPQRLGGQAKNPARMNYYRMFFTDGVVDSLHTGGEAPYVAHERDLFAAMKLPFLDFFMAGVCRTVEEILNTDGKPYGEMVEGRPMEPPEHPLPNDVYLNYLERVEGTKLSSPSTITNQRMAYRAFLKENLC